MTIFPGSRGNPAGQGEADEAVAELRAVAGKGSDREAVLNTMQRQLEYLSTDVERFPLILQAFRWI